MGNLCTHDSDKLEHLETKLDEQNEFINKIQHENQMLKRENKYFKNRLENILIHH